MYSLQHGLEHTDDGPLAVSAVDIWKGIDYGPTYEDALKALSSNTLAYSRTLKKIDGGLFKHLPGVEGVFLEEWLDGNKQQKSQIWLIRRLTA